jgi:hypothetical protein
VRWSPQSVARNGVFGQASSSDTQAERVSSTELSHQQALYQSSGNERAPDLDQLEFHVLRQSSERVSPLSVRLPLTSASLETGHARRCEAGLVRNMSEAATASARRIQTKHFSALQSRTATLNPLFGDRGVEPLGDFDAKRNSASTSIDRQQGAAARALHSGGPNCHCLASLDADLQRVIAAWDGLPTAIRRATLALIGAS